MVDINKSSSKTNRLGTIRRIFRFFVIPTVCILYAYIAIQKYREDSIIENQDININYESSSGDKTDINDNQINCDTNQDNDCHNDSTEMKTDLSQFSYSLFSLLAKTEDTLTENSETTNNVLISPFSIASALALVLSGSTKNSLCETELQSTLSISSHEQIPALSNQILGASSNFKNSKDSKGVSFKSANGIWVKGSIKPSFIKSVQEVHSATAAELPSTYDPIDAFISEKTEGMISNMLEGPVDPLIQAVLVNAVHFKGKWETQFDPKNSMQKTFYTMNGEKHKANFMCASREMDVATKLDELSGGSMVMLDYEDSSEDESSFFRHTSPFRAMFLLPAENTPKSMNDLISSLESLGTEKSMNTSLGKIIKQKLRFQKTELSLPRFKVSWGVESLKPHLMGMGMKAAFEPGMAANSKPKFDLMSDDPQLYLDDVLHKAVMEVTEEGTEAAAATAAVMMTRSMPLPPLKMSLNRPFIMIVFHMDTLTPLFMSRIDLPDFN